ncbi:MAG: RNA polymerase sigma factor RpoD/SigA [Hydrogenothermaceae bacterium]
MKKFRYEEGVDYYIKSIYKIPLLTAEEEGEILRRVKEGDKDALSKLIKSNLRFVISIAKRYAGYNIPFQDIISAGNLGLIEAANRYDPSRGVKFISYAVWWIKQSIHQLINSQREVIRKPDKVQSLANKIDTIYNKLKEESYKEPTVEDIFEHLKSEEVDINIETIKNYILDKKLFISIDEPINSNGEDLYFEDILSLKGTEDVEKDIFTEDLERLLKDMLENLSEREKKILIHRYGLFGEEPKTLSEVGQIVGISRERVRQIESRLLKKLRKIAVKRSLKDLIS